MRKAPIWKTYNKTKLSLVLKILTTLAPSLLSQPNFQKQLNTLTLSHVPFITQPSKRDSQSHLSCQGEQQTPCCQSFGSLTLCSLWHCWPHLHLGLCSVDFSNALVLNFCFFHRTLHIDTPLRFHFSSLLTRQIVPLNPDDVGHSHRQPRMSAQVVHCITPQSTTHITVILKGNTQMWVMHNLAMCDSLACTYSKHITWHPTEQWSVTCRVCKAFEGWHYPLNQLWRAWHKVDDL